jgi:copper chaperone
LNTTTNFTVFTVAGMSCGHCVAAVTEAVSTLEHVGHVEVDLETGAVTVCSAGPIDHLDFASAIDAAGFEVVS